MIKAFLDAVYPTRFTITWWVVLLCFELTMPLIKNVEYKTSQPAYVKQAMVGKLCKLCSDKEFFIVHRNIVGM